MEQDRTVRFSKIALVALGSNIGSEISPQVIVGAALDRLRHLFSGLRSSSMYSTPAFPEGSGPDFVNAACAFETDAAATDILAILHAIEDEFERTRDERWGPRTLDLDLLALGDVVLPDQETHADWRALTLNDQLDRVPDQLILPHPRLQDRSFVLVPLADVAPDWIHPILSQTVTQLLEARPKDERNTVVPL